MVNLLYHYQLGVISSCWQVLHHYYSLAFFNQYACSYFFNNIHLIISYIFISIQIVTH